jgi:CheY-like chemotaxis protein
MLTEIIHIKEKPQILVVDDCPIDVLVMLEHLRGDFTVSVAESGNAAVEICLGANPPRVILLDANMPGMDGYQTCKKLKADPLTQCIEVIFVSANETIEERLKGYDVGGSDYLIKPILAQELCLKIRKALERQRDRESAELETQCAMDTAMTAIMDAGEQAGVVHFLRDSFACNSFEDLTSLIFDYTGQIQLSSSLQIRAPWKTYEYASSGSISPIEVNIFEAMQHSSRIIQHGKRLFLNFGVVSQIIKNLPDDEEKVGRLRDHLAIILEGAANRIKSLIVTQQLKNLMFKINESLLRVKDQQSKQKKQGVKIMDDLVEEIQTNFINYGLTEEQEIILISLVESYAERSFSSYEDGLKIDAELKVIAEQIKHAFDKVH